MTLILIEGTLLPLLSRRLIAVDIVIIIIIIQRFIDMTLLDKFLGIGFPSLVCHFQLAVLIRELIPDESAIFMGRPRGTVLIGLPPPLL